MPAKANNEVHNCEYFSWRMYRRDNIYYADGRGAEIGLRRLSLGTRDRDQALKNLRILDRRKAIEVGKIMREGSSATADGMLSIQEGLDIYKKHLDRPEVAKGVRPNTKKRYRPVMAHFTLFCDSRRISSWNEVTAEVLNDFGRMLEVDGYKPRSIYLEMTTIKQISKYLIEYKYLPSSCAFRCRMSKPQGTDVHCYSAEEVSAILELTKAMPELERMHHALVGLAYTGLRIQELAGLRWSDLSDDLQTINLTDQGHRSKQNSHRRRTKTGRSRSLPVHPQLKELLLTIPRDPSRFVFVSQRGHRLNDGRLRNQLIRNVIGPLSERFPSPEGEKGFKDARLHSFRHFFCSRMATVGTPQLVLQKWLGHRNSAMVQHYFDLSDADSHARMSSIELLPVTKPGAVDN